MTTRKCFHWTLGRYNTTQHGYLAIWDQEGASSAPIQKLAGDAIAGAKSRRGAGYDYIGGGSR
jgi:hypothetical protein